MDKSKFKILSISVLSVCCLIVGNVKLKAEDGYRLWLRYDKIENSQLRNSYSAAIQQISVSGESETINAVKSELKNGLDGLLDKSVPFVNDLKGSTLIAGTPQSSRLIANLSIEKELKEMGDEGYLIFNKKTFIIIAANTDIGVLYGSFHFLRVLQTHQSVNQLSIHSKPKTKHRVLNHWYNIDGTTGPTYGGWALWDWSTLPDYIDSRYKDYARANASVGINGVVLTNVVATILRPEYLEKVAALSRVFRPYGIKVYLGVDFNSPIKVDSLATADPLDPEVREWWKTKTDEIYKLIPDFGGYTVKANSEGRPGPLDYHRSFADGANMLGEALAPHNGVVFWRAFVYSNIKNEDRAKQAYDYFKPHDGEFDQNVLLQVKNGPIDFQPREPFHPLFGSMSNTPLMIEFEINQEYLGWATSLVYLGNLYKEVLDSDTYAYGKGSTVGKIIDGSLERHELSGMAGIANIGTDRNWCGHPFAQANWYVFGRLAWDHELTADQIADEWIRMTFSNDPLFIEPVKEMMSISREASVNYRAPMGLYLTTDYSHYGPAPWKRSKYHKADLKGIGVDRTASGSGAVKQYADHIAHKLDDIKTIPENLLLWFHHVSWDYKLDSGHSLWQELVHYYYSGVDSVSWMKKTWSSLGGYIDQERYRHVYSLLKIQEEEARFWRDACVLYFQEFSKQPIPLKYEKPEHDLPYYKNPRNKYNPGL